jgi:tetratricopeptide (TPR) repeat protein
MALLSKQQLEQAIEEFRRAIQLDPKYAEAHHNIGKILFDKHQLTGAIWEFRAAIAIDSKLVPSHYALGIALYFTGHRDEAIKEYRKVIDLKPQFAPVYNNLGQALEDKWQLAEAIAYYRKGIQLDPQDDMARNNLRRAEQLARLNDRLPAIMQDKAQPKDASERLAIAQLCQQEFHKRYAAATRFYIAAFAEKHELADDLNLPHRYNAACAAALAATGQGEDADKLGRKERTRLHKQALDWLHADLKAYRQVMAKTADKAYPEIAQRMQDWLRDTDFAGVRGPAALGQLAETERGDWQELWEEVEALRQRALKSAQPASPARP